MLSIIGVLTGVFAFGTYMIPLKKYPNYSSWAFLAVMAVGALFCSTVIAGVTGQFNLAPVGIFCGLGQLPEIDNVRNRDDVAHVARGGCAADMRLDLGIAAVIVGSQFNSTGGNGND